MTPRRDGTVEMICSVSELADLFRQSQDLRGFLNQVVHTLVLHMKADVCSIYLYDEHRDRLVLEATEGLNKDLVGQLTLSPGEGLTGRTLAELKIIHEDKVRNNPTFKLIPESGEERFESFLAVPIVIRDVRRVGVLVLQDEKAAGFSKEDVLALKAITSQLAATLENARLLMHLPDAEKNEKTSPKTGSIIRGTPVVEGAALGRAYLMGGPEPGDVLVKAHDHDYRSGLQAFQEALAETESQLEVLQARLEEEQSDVASLIFSAHLLMLRDDGFSGVMKNLIGEGMEPSEAVEKVANRYIGIFSESDNPNLREKVLDIKDLGHRLLKNLSEDDGELGDYSSQVVLTGELLPSELLKLTAQRVEGLVLYGGGATTHVAALASSLRVPMMYTEDEGLFGIRPDTPVALDAHQGFLLVNPNKTAEQKIAGLKTGTAKLAEMAARVSPETLSCCGLRIYLRATVNLLSDLKLASSFKAEGVGLYRSEFPFLIRSEFPSEEEQYRIYKQVVNALDDPIVTLRTLDVGGDKILSYLPDNREANPFLGLRAIRFLLENKKVFVGQLKAMLRAGSERPIRILFPLISSVDDFRRAKVIVKKSMGFLERDGYPSPRLPALGAMVELPSAVELAPELAKEADFLSLGTNDLVQYLLGVDRTNEKVADLFEIKHPAVFRAVKRVNDAAQAADCPLSVCGIMAEDPVTVYYLMGLGIREFSVESSKIPDLQEAIASMKLDRAQEDARQLSRLGTVKEIKDYLKNIPIFDQNT